MTITIRNLVPADAPAYAAFRTEMLADTPHAFTASPGDDPGQNIEGVRASLAGPNYAIVGAFDENQRLVGVAGINRQEKAKRAHIAWVWGVYVTPSCRGQGVARRLIAGTIQTARSWPGVQRMSLSVSATSATARRVYESHGFIAWGTEPDALRTGGKSYDEVYLSLDLAARA
jgi:RimJ/RimL family protein N-acetyltransferase